MGWIIFGIIFGLSATILGFSIPKIVEYNSLKNDNGYYYVYHSSTRSDFYNATKDFPTFTFAQFLKFYNLNSDSWVIYKQNRVVPLPAKRGKDLPGYYKGSRVYHPIFFTNIFEYFKYKKWAKKKLKEATKKANMERQTTATKEFIALIQEDIDAIRLENEKIIQETEDTLCKSLTNLQREEKERKMVNGELCENIIYRGVESNGKPVRAYVSTKYNENMQIAGSVVVTETGDTYIYNGRNWIKYNDF